MKRRTVVRALGGVGTGATAGLAGCLTRNGDDEPPNGDDGDPEPDEPRYDGTLRVATYRSMVDGPNPAGEWLEEAFTEEFPDAELEWVVPNGGVDHYIRRSEYGGQIDVDVLFGFTVGDLARIDERIEEGSLLRELNLERVEGVDEIQDEYEFGDPLGRALPFDTGFVNLVYDGNELEGPETFEELLDGEYEDTLLAQDPRTSNPGQAFFLWTIDAMGADDAFEWWEQLVDADVDIHRSWSDSYVGAYLEEERPMVVSYSTDPAFAAREADDTSRHQVAFLDDEGYALPEGMGIFEEATEPDLAYGFLSTIFTEEAQSELAHRNLQFPVIDGIDTDSAFDGIAREPSDPVALGYDDLEGSVTDWLEEWDDRVGDDVLENE
ncbi:thiamine ABC transporter substrate-binding protein [Natronorubrum daqingense]|uniref:ABC transporter substrate-binding protein n=1 Tax=Natronorubrum daqingense TaxID=588898 RepID=A0A1N7F8Y1_9EURY|nr:thiamine ABC transporter substrate-binding protein [Natronorubrum daqingense]APX97619.1 ABC transporter substrate-binding protein [Natronorubrum daqingense]SIR96797.1 thiamine transport system substrate-binding protein [Natronorubrum daqingense]